ncbi:secreted protein [Massariosphaeria phaeospora]|uniref:Secreted protein n=1 Tax=Massariosphaeria phaeospora TaxID=100035 RepID=A0A7C8IHC0_9PLEO|nr:secreted protein [Massariosphaeria phaeospora]
MPSLTLLSAALLTSGGLAHAYTQVNIATPFMTKNIDPIVFPGQHNKSHLHSFYGSDAVTIDTKTSAELQSGCTAAENPNDLSVYWTPTVLYQKGSTWEPVPVSRFSAYYSLGDTKAEVPIPQNLQMVAGNAQAQTADTMVAEAHSEWFCEGSDGGPLDKNGFPSKACTTHLQQLLYFPNCVDTTTLKTAYKAGRPGAYKACPAGTKAMPQLRFSIRYDVRKALPGGWSGTAPLQLACGPAHCSHGDFINGWTADAALNMVAATAEKNKFASVDGKLGKNGVRPTCKAADADPKRGTGNYAESVKAMSKREVVAVGWASRARLVRAL